MADIQSTSHHSVDSQQFSDQTVHAQSLMTPSLQVSPGRVAILKELFTYSGPLGNWVIYVVLLEILNGFLAVLLMRKIFGVGGDDLFENHLWGISLKFLSF